MIDKKTSHSIWHPTILFKNLMKKEDTKFYGGTVEGTMEYLYDMNRLVYVETFLLKFSCEMNFTMFPFDSNRCCLNYWVVGKLINYIYNLTYFH